MTLYSPSTRARDRLTNEADRALLRRLANGELFSDNEPENPPKKTSAPSGSSFASFRELVETLAIALFLSILFKFFEAEAYVIPTSSMAPTLLGRHKDVNCQQCDYPFQVSASEEFDSETNRLTGIRTEAGTCPICGFTQYFPPETPSFSGDRVMVNKCVDNLRDVRRWDVSVFRCPADPKNNYIKRIVGLPNENLRIQYGDIFVQKRLSDGRVGPFEIARKPLENLRQMLQIVHDNDYAAPRLTENRWPPRWADDLARTDTRRAGWLPTDNGRGFYFGGESVPKPAESIAPLEFSAETVSRSTEESSEGFAWIRYRHTVPSSEDWLHFLTGKTPPNLDAAGRLRNNPQLITDQTAFNSGLSKNDRSNVGSRLSYYIRRAGDQTFCLKSPDGFGYNWIGDLAISCDLSFGEFTAGEAVAVELVKGGIAFRATLFPAEGRVRLEIPGVAEYQPEEAPYLFRANQTLSVMFLNVDEQMRLVLEGREIEFPNGGKYDHLSQNLPDGTPGILPRNRDPNRLDLAPVAIGAKLGGVEVRRLKILRDIYYIAMGEHLEPLDTIVSRRAQPERRLVSAMNRRCDRLFAESINLSDEAQYTTFLSQPSAWSDYGNTRSALFTLGDEQYLALGDNSGLSLDSRLWETTTIPYYIDRELMLGKAFCVYWPHGRMIPGTSLPLIPNFSKMRRID